MSPKKFLPIFIFFITFFLGFASIVISYKLQKRVPEILISEEEAKYYNDLCSGKIPGKEAAPGEWCCGKEGGDKGSSFNGNVYCQLPDGQKIAISGATVKATVQRCKWHNDDGDLSFRCGADKCGNTDVNPKSFDLPTNPQGFWGGRISWGRWDKCGFWLRSAAVSSLPETITLDRNITYQGNTYPAGTQIPTAQMQGPAVSCAAYSHECSGCCCLRRQGGSHAPHCEQQGTCGGNTIKECELGYPVSNLNFRYTNCLVPPAPLCYQNVCTQSPNNCPSGLACQNTAQGLRCVNPACPTDTDCVCPVSFVCQDLTRAPITNLEIGDTISFICSHQAENIQLDHYEFRWSLDGGTTYTTLDANNTTGTTGPHTISQAGNYVVQCRACATTGSTRCTDWGQTGGWIQ